MSMKTYSTGTFARTVSNGQKNSDPEYAFVSFTGKRTSSLLSKVSV